MGRSILVITLALLTMFLVLGWAWYTRREALSGPHYFGERDEGTSDGPDLRKDGETGGSEVNVAKRPPDA